MSGFTREVLVALAANIETSNGGVHITRPMESLLNTQELAHQMMLSVFSAFFITT